LTNEIYLVWLAVMLFRFCESRF